MKYFRFVLIWTLFPLWSQTPVSGSQSGTWTASGSPYQVTGHVTVPAGQTLTIEPGVRVEFQGRYRIYVDGKVVAQGTEDQPILFTATDHQAGWAGIRLDQTPDISEFYYCRFEYGKTDASGSYPDQHGGAVVLKDADAEFYHCVFAYNDATGNDDGMGGAVYGINTGTTTQTRTRFEDCVFTHNHTYGEGGAVKLTNDGHTAFIRCHFDHNTAGYGGGALFFYTAEGVTISQCSFYENTADNSGGGAIKTLNPQTSISLVNCTFTQNHADGYAEGGAVDLSYADAVFTNCIIYNNTQQYGKDVNIGQNATAAFHYCDVDMPDTGTGDHNLANVDPLFVNAGTGDLHLQSGSPCIDAGTDVGLPYAGAAPDIGCYEYGLTAVDKTGLQVFSLYPIPAGSAVFIRLVKEGPAHVRLLDGRGRMIREKDFSGSTHLSLWGLKPGVYLMQLRTNDGLYLRRLLKQ